jgi:hypothetical protein
MKQPKDQITWKRNEKATGLAAIGHDNSRRAWILCINGMDVGMISHTQSCASSLRWAHKEEAPAWKIMFYMNKGGNLTMKKPFLTPDRETEATVIEDAKKTMLEFYPTFRVKYPDARQAPPAKGSKAPEIETPEPKTAPTPSEPSIS